ncbi:MAG TPA: MFS transporter, partial [Stellaceae bacterium]|nr:MFS transporter [Stellaceae bacterium]
GVGFALETRFWPLLLIAFVGTLNPSAGDVSLFLPLEQAVLAELVPDRHRTQAFAAYALTGSLFGAVGALLAALPDLLAPGWGKIPSFQAMFGLYSVLGLVIFLLYRRLPAAIDGVGHTGPVSSPLGPSRRIVFTLAALFSLDSFAGGLVVQTMMTLWLAARFGLGATEIAAIFFWTGLLSALSVLAAARLARRFGLINTMVFTHLPANLCLILVPFAPGLGTMLTLLFIRSALSQMDVPARTSYVMAVVTPPERVAAASVTNLPRSLAAAAGPLAAGYLLALSAFGWPLVLAGALKGTYDLLLLGLMRHHRPPEER